MLLVFGPRVFHVLSTARAAKPAGAGNRGIAVKKFILNWIVNTLAVLVAVYVVPGIHYQKPLDLLVASLLLGIFNAVLRPILMILALPLLIFTLGLFTLVINALLLYFIAGLLQPHFSVDTFGSAFWGALIISLIALILNVLTGTGSRRVQFRHQRRSRRSGPDDRGPVIDI
jgi:putative membrane protein